MSQCSDVNLACLASLLTYVWLLCLDGSFQNQALILSLKWTRTMQHHITLLDCCQNGVQIVPVDFAECQALQ